jgi:hypothetical protein
MGYIEKYFSERIDLGKIMVEKMSEMNASQFDPTAADIQER